ncbi:ABC transporter permease [Hydrogenimonas cancrithermarum]|uniref:Membrane protein n=1 Tax=Hydrogenimonas cancrithermarum TaxID=2993563 RepID=A0ABM8FIR1_9BACT|nr:ABC transporter permease [Hydrogenimonas cancrithermarum]BDY12174.1 membrane protein [Hydrogenimonas cancrithermarum]
MNRKFVNTMVRRYLRFDREHPFIFLSAILAFLGIAIGVTVLIIAMAIMNGMEKEFEKRLFVMNYPLTIYPKVRGAIDDELLETLENKFIDLKFSPYMQSQVLVRNGGTLKGGLMFGIDPEREKEVNEVFAKAYNKSFGKYGVIIGKPLARELNIDIGDKIMFLFSKMEPAGLSMMPLAKRFRVEGLFRSGLNAYDESYYYTSFRSLEKILKRQPGQYDGIHIVSENPMHDIGLIRSELPSTVGIVGWWQQNGNFFAAMQMEKRALFIVLMLIILIASLNIVSSLLMTVMNRRNEVALLLSLGASKKEILQIFFRLGLIIGVGGVVVGTLLGLGGMELLKHFDIISLPEDVYGTSRLPLDLDWSDFVSIIVGAFIITLLSSFYPAKKASQIDSLKVLRNE